MAWEDGQVKGFNCRGTSGYVTDPTDTTYFIATLGNSNDEYPVTRNDVTFGLSVRDGASPTNEDRDSSVTDKRLAGRAYAVPGTPFTIRVDLPAAGDYIFRMANGDTAFDFSPYRQMIAVLDTSTPVLSFDSGIGSTGPAQDTYYDASGVNRSEANWPSANVGVTLTFATTICNIVVGDASAGYTALAHFSLERVAVGGHPAQRRFGLMDKTHGESRVIEVGREGTYLMRAA